MKAVESGVAVKEQPWRGGGWNGTSASSSRRADIVEFVTFEGYWAIRVRNIRATTVRDSCRDP